MSTRSFRLGAAAILAVAAAAALAAFTAPAGAAQQPCSTGYDLYVINPLTDSVLVAADLDRSGTVCVATSGDVASVVDDSELAALLTAALPTGLVAVDAPVSIDGTQVTTGDILSTDQRGNRNNVVGAGICSQNTGNSCFSNNKLLQNIRIVLIDDAISL